MNPLPNTSSQRFEERWEQLKPIIERLYLEEGRKLADVASIMKNQHGFDALGHQYKHRFKKWQWKKSIPKSKMEKIATQRESRARAGKSSTTITYHGRPVDAHKIRRYMKDKARETSQMMSFGKTPATEGVDIGPVLPFANSIFLKWNLPYEAMRRLHALPLNHSSPMQLSVSTPGSSISVHTPAPTSPSSAPSPTAVVQKKKTAVERAYLFAKGQHDKLLTSMDGDERRLMSEWLYQYWFFCFKTAKHWGKGPYAWTAELLDFSVPGSSSRRSLPGTPRDPISRSEELLHEDLTPTHLCRWCIHVAQVPYESLPEYQFSEDLPDQDPKDESTWLPWPEHRNQPPLPTRLRDALEHNDFSSIPAKDLPVAIPQIAKAAQRSPDELLIDSLGFNIMTRNTDQLYRTLKELERKNIDFTSLFPFHMAASYLDGHRSCCAVFEELVGHVAPADLRKAFVNDLGHTILDNLMISILKSHSSATPSVFDSAWKDNPRFVGEEVDICGRWDADSPCIRQLLAEGNPSIPLAWKHKFCHTSTQTICHCICWLKELAPTSLLGETASGLFTRHCFLCGTRLQLQPLHSLVMTSYHLLNNGCPDEDLFGMLACLLCLIAAGLDPQMTANISVNALMQSPDEEIMCDHEELTPGQLANRIAVLSEVQCWSKKARTGWAVLCGVLYRCEDNTEDLSRHGEDEHDEDEDEEDKVENVYVYHRECHTTPRSFHNHPDLATLLVSVQAELLSYRRLGDGMSWMSDYFSMEELEFQLSQGERLSVKYSQLDLLKPHCECGGFNPSPSILKDVTNPDIANLDVWGRANYIGVDIW